MLFQNCGLYWFVDDVYFGKVGGGSVNKGELLGNRTPKPFQRDIDFAEQIGVYALYANFSLIYVGQVGGGAGNRLLNRLRQHSNDGFKGRWNRFSWFGLRRVNANGHVSNENEAFHPSRQEVLDHVEGIILQFAEPPLNGQDGRFGDTLEEYEQVRHPSLGLTDQQMLREVHKKIFRVKTGLKKKKK